MVETRFFSNPTQLKPYRAGSEKDYVYNQVNQGLANLEIVIKITISGLYEKRKSPLFQVTDIGASCFSFINKIK